MDRGDLPRWLAVWLGLRRLSPADGQAPPGWRNIVERLCRPAPDTGGGVFRPPFRGQSPNVDPREPQGGEGSSAGEDHAWNGCTMSSGGMAHGWHVQDGGTDDTPWGGDLRHAPGQPDMSGGTDLYDLRDAWEGWSGAELKIKSGQGWGAVRDARADWRAIVLQGTGNTPGEGSYTGAHAVVVLPERDPSGDEWLMGDPLTSGYQWVPESKLRSWAEAFSSGIAFAVSKGHPPKPPEPEPEPPEPEPEPPGPAPAPEPPPVPAPMFWGDPGPSTAAWDGSWWDAPGWQGRGLWPLPWPDVIPSWSAATWAGSWTGSTPPAL
jgi:hypothetical protein